MNLSITRAQHRVDATIGTLQVNDQFECFTCELPMRTDRLFVPGECALPTGFYNVSIARNVRIGRDLPLLASTRPQIDTPNRGTSTRLARIGMWISPGRSILDDDSLILIGQLSDGHTVERTRAAFDELMAKMVAAIRRGEAIDLEIR